MPSRDLSSRYKAILADVAKQLGCEPGDEQAKQVAFLYMVRDNMTAAAIRGERVNVADATELDDRLRRYLPERKLPDTINVQLVESLQGKCCKCGHMNVVPARQVADVVRVNGEKVDIAPASATSDGKPPTAADSAAPAAPTEPAKPIEPGVKGYLEGLSQSGFHSAVLNNGERAPLKKLERGYGPRRVVSPLSVDPGTAAPRRHNAPPQGSAFLDPNPSRKA